MKKVINKIIASLIVFMIICMNVLPSSVHAVNIINEIIESSRDEVVEFDANINNEHTVEASINDELALNLNISLLGEGYLKNIKIVLEDNNYVVSKTAEEINATLLGEEGVTNVNKIINSIEGNEISTKELDNGEELKIALPIKFNNEKNASKESFDSNSKIKLVATYVNGKDDDKTIEKTIQAHVKWNVQAENEITQELVRYLKYEDKTMVSFEITDGIKNNTIPVESKEIDVTIPTINDKQPENITVVGKQLEKNIENGTLKLTKLMEPEDGNKYSWNSTERYTVTYIYNTQTEGTTISTKATSKSKVLSGDIIEAETQVNDFDVNAEVGSIVQLDIALPKEINKGYIYTNLNRPEEKLNTQFDVNYKVNIGYAELTNKITIEEGAVQFNNEQGNQIVDATSNIKTNNIAIEEEELVDILGDEGKITIRNAEGKEIGTLNKEKTSLDVETGNVVFEISQPKKEGDINIKLQKQINGDNSFETSQMVAFKQLKAIAKIKGYNEENEITNKEEAAECVFTEPTSKATIDTNTDSLSTVSGNKDVEINVVLNKTDISDALYVDPIIKITLPEEVTNITLKSAKIVYDEQLLIENVEQNGREITFKLTGTQTEYNTLKTTKGTLLRIVGDLGVDLLAPSNETKIIMEYTNKFTSETKTTEKKINIVAPTQIVTTNQIDIDGQTAFALDKDVELLKVKNGQQAKTMQITGQIVNNMGSKAEGVQIIGRIPTAGNKTIGGVELCSNISSTLASPIELGGFANAQVYYSANVEEPLNGQGWQEQATTDTKSFKIVLPEGMENRTAGGFRYTVTVPANLDYEQAVKTNYGLYYNNNSEQGATQNLVESKVLGIETGKAPEIKVNIQAFDTNEGYEIKEGDTVKEGQYITYKVNVQNTGTTDAHDVKVKVNLPDGIIIINRDTKYIVEESWTRELNNEISVIKGGEKTSFAFETQVSQIIFDNQNEEITEEQKINNEEDKKLKISIETTADILQEKLSSEFTVNNSKGSLAIGLIANVDKYIEPNQEIIYRIKLDNSNIEEKNNVKVVLNLDEGIKYKEMLSDYKATYNESNNTVTVNIEKLENRQIALLEIVCQNKSEEQKQLSAYASTECNQSNGIIKSNYVNVFNNVTKKVIDIVHTSNITTGATDKDNIEFNISIKNTSNFEQVLEFKDNIPEELDVIEYTVSMDNNIIEHDATNYITELITLPVNKTIKVTIKAKPFPIEEGKSIQIENKPIIIADNGDEINVDLIKMSIEGTTQKEVTVNTTESIEDTKEQKQDETYKIVGCIWLDENRNGIKEIEESRLSGITARLINAKNNEIVKYKSGNEVTTTTNSNGEYIFTDLEKGNYIVQVDYDNKQYDIAEYKVDNTEESLNCDFVRYKENDKTTAVTDIVKLKNANIFNIDLGLVKVEQLNISVNQSIARINIIGSNNKLREINANETTTKLELTNKELKDSTVLVEYNIKVTNYGDIAGYAKQIIENVPEGMKFKSEINPDWYMGKNGELYTVSLSDKLIQPEKSEDIRLVLTKKITENELGIIRGKAEIKTTYSETGLTEIRALSASQVNSESDVSTSDLIILKKINIKAISVIGITIGIFALLVLAVYETKKHIINKLYNIDDIE